MRTAIIIGIGLVLLGLCILIGYLLAGTPGITTAAFVFLVLWLAVASVNMYVGVKRAGYSIAEETPIFLVILGVPLTAALLAWWALR